MTQSNEPKEDKEVVEELWSNSVASAYLTEQLPERDSEQWGLWLRNNRNQSRKVPYRIGFERISNATFYRPEELSKFVEWEKSRQLGVMKLTGRSAEVMRAFGIGSSNGSTTGRKLKILGINDQIDEATGQSFVQLIISEPLMVFRLDPEQAREVAAKLFKAARSPRA